MPGTSPGTTISGASTMIRPRRSLLFMPGSNARALEKARTLPADGIILDLEDSVAADAKAVARDQVAAAARPDGILVPKIASVADLAAIADRLSDIGADHTIRIWIMIETPLGVL